MGEVSFVDAIAIDVQENTTLTTSCDGLSALKQVGRTPDSIRWCSKKHVDLVSTLADFWNRLQFTPVTEHVYGHRDESNYEINNNDWKQSLAFDFHFIARAKCLHRRIPNKDFCMRE